MTFDCPRYWDGNDLSTMKVYVNYIRVDGAIGSYLCDDPTIDADNPDLMHFNWTISGNVTQVSGPLTFLVCIKMVDEDGDETNHWNSELNTDMYVSVGMQCHEPIIFRHPDIISQLLLRADEIEEMLEKSDVEKIAADLKSVEAALAILSNPDTTLTKSGMPADAKATGTAINAHLANVPNVTTNDQTPTYAVASDNAELVSGETLTTAFGKIAKAIKSFIAHLADSVSHITSDERTTWNAKAAGTHNHAASEITSGTLGLARGGTGQTTAPKSLYALINGSTALTSAGLATDDCIGVGDVSAATGKKVTLENLTTYLGGRLIVTGSYVGTGTVGSANPNTITFSKKPKIIIMLGYTNTKGKWYSPVIITDGWYTIHTVITEILTTSSTEGAGLGQYSSSTKIYGNISDDGLTYSWYSTDSDADSQFNESGYTYYYALVY